LVVVEELLEVGGEGDEEDGGLFAVEGDGLVAEAVADGVAELFGDHVGARRVCQCLRSDSTSPTISVSVSSWRPLLSRLK